MDDARGSDPLETVIIGGGQAGLSTGYHLARRGLPFLILDANERIGDSWRKRWDSLRLFTPARFSGLSGMSFPAPAQSFPTKDEVANYLESYASRFELPVRTGVRVDGLSRNRNRFVVTSGDRRFEAENVVVAMASYQIPRVPSFASELDPGILQLHAGEYRNPSRLQGGGVLVVGAGNTGAEIALDVVGGHPTWLSGRDTHHVPGRIDTVVARRVFLPLVYRVVGHHVLTVKTPIGRRVRRKVLSRGAPLVRVKPKDIAAAGIERVPRVVGVRDGLPVLEDQRVLEVANVIWCTGFRPDFSWIHLPVFGDEEKEPMHHRGIVAAEPGLYFVGLVSSRRRKGREAHREAHRIVATERSARRVGAERDAVMIFGIAPACHRASPELPSGASWAPRIVQRGHLPRPEPPGPPVLSIERLAPRRDPVCGPDDVRRLIDHWRWLVLGDEIAERGSADWLGPERALASVGTIDAHRRGSAKPPGPRQLIAAFSRMALPARDLGGRTS